MKFKTLKIIPAELRSRWGWCGKPVFLQLH
jgi:hypothetical protein